MARETDRCKRTPQGQPSAVWSENPNRNLSVVAISVNFFITSTMSLCRFLEGWLSCSRNLLKVANVGIFVSWVGASSSRRCVRLRGSRLRVSRRSPVSLAAVRPRHEIAIDRYLSTLSTVMKRLVVSLSFWVSEPWKSGETKGGRLPEEVRGVPSCTRWKTSRSSTSFIPSYSARRLFQHQKESRKVWGHRTHHIGSSS
jgi:hypothetical protein